MQDGRNLLMTYASSIGDYGFAGGGIEDGDYDVFQSVHEYFPCQVREGAVLPTLESYERDLGLVSCWVDLEVALAANRAISAGLVADNPWIPREIIMLEVLLDRAKRNGHAGVPDAGGSPCGDGRDRSP